MSWFGDKVGGPMIQLLRQGLTPEGLAWSLSVGLALGITPLFGTSTALCVGASLAFRLNQAAMQLANYFAYPLQLALLIPFVRLGERLFGTPHMPLSLPVIQAAIKADTWGALGQFWTSLWHASVAWLLLVPIPTVLLAWLLIPILRTVGRPFLRP